jgi:hypothetical protein
MPSADQKPMPRMSSSRINKSSGSNGSMKKNVAAECSALPGTPVVSRYSQIMPSTETSGSKAIPGPTYRRNRSSRNHAQRAKHPAISTTAARK